MAPLLEQVRGRLGAYLYGIDVSGLEETVLHLLHQNGKTFSAAESCTGGLIANASPICREPLACSGEVWYPIPMR